MKGNQDVLGCCSMWTLAFNVLPIDIGVCMLSRFSCVQLFVTLWTVAHQVPLSLGFSSQEYWVVCHALLQGIFLTQGLIPRLLCLQYWQAYLERKVQ